MANDWILDVLTDLQAFAGRNGMEALERQLDIARETAVREVMQGQGMAGQGYDSPGRLYRGNADGSVV